MINIIDKKDCCGCWACANICPKHCITMVEDNEGFHYPVVDTSQCTDCGLCEKACPIKQPMQDDAIPYSFVVQHKDEAIRRQSTSGGFYTAISRYAIDHGGVVFGAAFDEKMTLHHSYCETLDGCAKFRGSKYVQSLIGNTYQQAKNFLKKGKLVVFSGTPCQIAGLHSFLGQEYKNLITVDLVCHGVPSPLLLRKYLAYHETKYSSQAVSYLSRDKYYGYDFSTATIKFENNSKKYHKGIESDMMLRFYFKNICSRPCCYACHFKTLNRVSDMTIFDCWDAKSVSSQFDNSGATNVFIHTPKGKDVFNTLKFDFIWNPSNIHSIIRRDGTMIKDRVPMNPSRADFFKALDTLPLSDIEKKYIGISNIRKLIAYMKPFFYKIGVFHIYLTLKRSLK